MQLAELVAMTREVTNLFDSDGGPWDAPVLLTELTGEVGTLADSIMIREGYRRPRDGASPDLDDDVVDVLFMLVRLADHYGVDLETAYATMIQQTREKLQNRVSAKKEREKEQR